MQRIVGYLLLSVLLLSACQSTWPWFKPRATVPQTADVQSMRRIHLPVFTAVQTKNVHLNLVATSGKPQLEMHGQVDVLHQTSAYVKNGVLYLENQNDAAGVTAMLKTNQPLLHLNVAGHGDVAISGVHGEDAVITVSGSGRVSFDSPGIDIAQIHFDSDGTLSINNVHAEHLQIEASGRGVLSLQGHVHQLHALLRFGVAADLRQMAISNIYVSTDDDSVATLGPVKRVFAVANDTSRIYYEGAPEFLGDIMTNNGAIMRYPDYARLQHRPRG